MLAAAGIDASNVPAGSVALLPLDPDASAGRIRDGLRERLGVDVAVIVTDTMGRPWRDGVVDTAIGASGIEVLDDLRGSTDTFGQLLEVTVTALADELAAAGDLVKGKLAGRPVAIVRGLDFRRPVLDRGARPLIRPAVDDMFATGTHDAQVGVVHDSAPITISPDDGGAKVADIMRAVEALGIPHEGHPLGHVTVSIGCATADPRRMHDAGALVEAADAALYTAKKSGKNRVVCDGEDARSA